MVNRRSVALLVLVAASTLACRGSRGPLVLQRAASAADAAARARATPEHDLAAAVAWVEANDRFECPCHGSKFLQTGTRIDGPARRNLDVFPIEVVDAAGNVLARTEPSMSSKEGTPVQLPSGAVALRIDTGRRVTGAPNSAPGGGI